MKLAAWLAVGAPLAVFLAGCGNPYARERNPSFAQGQMAAAPIATYPIMQCKALSGTLEQTMRVVMEQRSGGKLTGAPLMQAPETEGLLCSFVNTASGDRATLYGLALGDDTERWHVPIALKAAIQKLSAGTNAQTHVFTIAQQLESCTNPTSTMRDADGRTVATVQSSETVCSPSSRASVDVLVFNAKAELLWHGEDMVDTQNASSMDGDLQALAGRIPAAFGDPASMTTTTAATLPPVAKAAPPAPAPAPVVVAAPPPPVDPPVPSDVPSGTVGGHKVGFRQITLKGNSKAGYDVDLLEGGSGDGEIQAHIDGKLVKGRAMSVVVTSAAVGDADECTGRGTLTLSAMPAMKKASATPKVLGTAEGTLALVVQCKGDAPTSFVVQGPTRAELTVQK